MKVSLSAFYAFRRGATYQKTVRQKDLDERVRTCFYFHRRRYGTRRIAVELATGRAAVRAAQSPGKLAGDCAAPFQAEDDRLKPRFKNKPESVEEGRQRAGRCRTGDRRRYYLYPAGGRKLLLPGNLPGQIYAPDHRLGFVQENDGAACH